jgi:TPR repeat protein
VKKILITLSILNIGFLSAQSIAEIEKTCEKGYLRSCVKAGYYHANLAQNKDYKKARSLYEKACNLGDADACTNLAFMYKNGQGVAKDDAKATLWFEQACKSFGGEGCYNTALSCENGQGTVKNEAKAKELFEKSCILEYQLGCENYARLNMLSY